MNKQYIIMGDVTASRSLDASIVKDYLSRLTEYVNTNYAEHILSPFTITLGDEFQGITNSLHSSLLTLIAFEEAILKLKCPFRLHYVLNQGIIDTEINPDIAYGMLGEGLSTARDLLTSKESDKNRFIIRLDDPYIEDQLNALFEILSGFSFRWSQKDYELIYSMIQIEDDTKVASVHSKDRSQIWKRRRTLQIKEYNLTKKVMFNLIQQP